MKITNHTNRTIGLAGTPALVLDAGKTGVVDDEQYESLQCPRFSNWLERGLISVAEGGKLPPAPPKPTGVDVKHRGGGRYRVYVNGIDVSQELMSKAEAEALTGNYQ